MAKLWNHAYGLFKHHPLRMVEVLNTLSIIWQKVPEIADVGQLNLEFKKNNISKDPHSFFWPLNLAGSHQAFSCLALDEPLSREISVLRAESLFHSLHSAFIHRSDTWKEREDEGYQVAG